MMRYVSKNLLRFLICIIVCNFYASDVVLTDEAQKFLEFVNQYHDQTEITDNFSQKYNFLEKVFIGMITLHDKKTLSVQPWLFEYAFQAIRESQSHVQSFDSKFKAEVEYKETIIAALKKNDNAYLIRDRKAYLSRGGKCDDDSTERSCRKFPNMTMLGNLYSDYHIMYQTAKSENVSLEQSDFILFLKYMNRNGLDRDKIHLDNSAYIEQCIQLIKQLNIHEIIKTVQEEKRRKFQEIAQLTEQKKRSEQERRAAILVIERERRKKEKNAIDLACASQETLLRRRFNQWAHEAQINCQQKKDYVTSCFFEFMRAIEHKKKKKRELFEQQVMIPNGKYGEIINTLERNKVALVEEISVTSEILPHDNDKREVELVRIKQEHASVIRAKADRRIKGFFIKDLLNHKNDGYVLRKTGYVVEEDVDTQSYHVLQEAIAEQNVLRQNSEEGEPEKYRHNPYSFIDIWVPVKKV